MLRPVLECQECDNTQIVPPWPSSLPQDPAELSKRAWTGALSCINCGSRAIEVKMVDIDPPSHWGWDRWDTP